MKNLKLLTRTAIIFLVIVLFITSAATVFASSKDSSSDEIAETQANIDALEKELERISKEKKESEQELAEGKKDLKDAKKVKQKYDKKMNSVQGEIDVTEELIDDYDKQIANYESQIEEKENEINDKLDIYYARARSNFENGSPNLLEIILLSEDISDLLARIEMIEAIAAADNAFIDNLKEAKVLLEEYKTSVEESRAEQQTLLNSLDARKKELNGLVKESSAIVSKIEDGVEASIAEIEAAEKAWEEANRKLEAEIARLSTLESYVGGSYLWPTAGIYKISCKYGPRIHPITKKNSNHHGVDVAAPMNTPILAANSGKVITATYSSVYGNYVVIDHGGGNSTLYAHMTKDNVSVGDRVDKGDVIGWVGSTGWSTGAHLHFEIRVNNKTTDPLSHYNIKFKFV